MSEIACLPLDHLTTLVINVHRLALVEAECQNQDLQHQVTAAQQQLEQSKNNWYNRTVNSLREKGQQLAHRRENVQNKLSSLSRENSRDFNNS